MAGTHSDTFPYTQTVLAPFQCPTEVDSSLLHVIIVTHQLCFQVVLLQQLEFQPQQIIAYTCAQQIVHVYAEKNVSCLLLKHTRVSNRLLEFHVPQCLLETVLPDHRGIPSSIHGTFKFSDQMLTRGPQVATRRTATSWRRRTRRLT